MAYEGLGQYLQPKEQAADLRSGEAKRRAAEVSAWGVSAQRMDNGVTQEAWDEHRRVQDTVVGVNRGLVSRDDVKAYQQHQRENPFGRVVANGHLGSNVTPGQPAVARIFASQPDENTATVSPLVAYLRGQR